MRYDPSLINLINQTSEDYYDDLSEFNDIPEDSEDECPPEWIQEQLDEEIPL